MNVNKCSLGSRIYDLHLETIEQVSFNLLIFIRVDSRSNIPLLERRRRISEHTRRSQEWKAGLTPYPRPQGKFPEGRYERSNPEGKSPAGIWKYRQPYRNIIIIADIKAYMFLLPQLR